MYPLLYAITDFGDSAVTGSLALCLAAYLLVMRQPKAALAITCSFVFATLAIALGKIAFYSRCDNSAALFDIWSPSGHTSVSVAVYGMSAYLVSTSQTGKRRLLPYFVAVPLVMLIALSRLALNYHTKGDVIAGLIVGLAASFGAGRLFMRGEAVRCRWWPFAVIIAILLALLYGTHLPAEDFFSRLSEYIRIHIRAC